MMSKTQSNNENGIQNMRQLTNKNGDSCRKHQIKKQVFGEIKNVIHNQGNATPLKQDALINKCSSSKYLANNNVQSKRYIKNESKSTTNYKYQKANFLWNNVLDENFLDYFDFRGQCCSKPYKSDQQIWSEMNLYDDSFLNKLIDNDQRLPQEEDLISEVSNNSVKDSDQEFHDELNNEFNQNYWPDKNDFKGQCDIHLYLEKPLLVGDFTF
ncbi:uncharacterized protein LOC119610044 [Lucilia sericata]|uniref:uncharacterized protein LOC119610044 n=1 Tax=Lucilia sericata TaxID=13632 RepID=UPI0018A843C9|nr:uncharacterized protein LOC119610044 [Lucilia sericata]